MKKLAPLLSVLPLAAAIPPARRIPDVLAEIERRKRGAGLQLTQGQGQGSLSKSKEEDEATDVDTLYLDQPLDHFSKQKDDKVETFRQRYFYTSRFVKPSDTKSSRDDGGGDKKKLAFLCVGGEGPSMDASVLVNSVHCTGDMIGLAEKLFSEHGYDVHLFALEHRYYGESLPTKDKPGYLRGGALGGADEDSDENEDEDEAEKIDVDYTHLSSRQAVKDIVGFVQSSEALGHMNLASKDEKVTWITFGGSYPGMLSAWSHLLHPSDIFAAVSSSAPIQAQLDFKEYHEHAGKDLEDADVGGSKECKKIVEEGHGQAAAVLDGRTLVVDDGKTKIDMDKLAEMFNVCNGAEDLKASRRNREIFAGDGLIFIPAQSNDPSCEGEICDIKGLCAAMVEERKSNPNKSSLEILAGIHELQRGENDQCSGAKWQDYLDWYKTTTTQNANDVSWLYQTCNEFGFYQTCNEDSSCPYAKGYHEVSRDLEFCQVVYGIDPDTVRKNVDSTLSYYGGRNLTPNAEALPGLNVKTSLEAAEENALDGQKRIIFITGDVDPWTELSYTKKGNYDHPSVSVAGASHHFWTHEVKDSDGKHIADARKSIYDTVSSWLGVSNDLATESVFLDTD